MVKVTCKKCGYEWDTKSELIKVGCPSCNARINRIEALKLSDGVIVKKKGDEK